MNESEMANRPALRLDHVVRRYPEGDGFLEILCGAELCFGRGRRSRWSPLPGPANRRLLHIAGLLEKPDSGEVDDRGRGHLRHGGPRAHQPAPRPRSASSISSTICCRNSRRWKMSMTAADDRRTDPRGSEQARVGIAPLPRPRSARKPSPVRAFGRRTAARRHRPRRRQCALAAAGRRTYRQSRSGDRRPRFQRPDVAGPRDRPRGPDRNPQQISPHAWTAGLRFMRGGWRSWSRGLRGLISVQPNSGCCRV